jgi:hypothetical protein
MSYLQAKGWLTKEERELLRSLAQTVPEDGLMVNIGIEYGASAHCLRAGNSSADLIGIDLIGADKFEGEPVMTGVLKGDSASYAISWDRPIDLLFIDGDHTFDGVMGDVFFARNVVIGGWVAFHDCFNNQGGTHPICPGVNKAVDAWLDNQGERWVESDPVSSTRYFQRVQND